MIERQKREHHRLWERPYKAYFDMKLGDQSMSWAPNIVLKTCVETLRGLTNEKLKTKFTVQMVWRKTRKHFDDCYFCLNDLAGFNKNKKKTCKNLYLKSAIRRVVFSGKPVLFSQLCLILRKQKTFICQINCNV